MDIHRRKHFGCYNVPLHVQRFWMVGVETPGAHLTSQGRIWQARGAFGRPGRIWQARDAFGRPGAHLAGQGHIWQPRAHFTRSFLCPFIRPSVRPFVRPSVRPSICPWEPLGSSGRRSPVGQAVYKRFSVEGKCKMEPGRPYSQFSAKVRTRLLEASEAPKTMPFGGRPGKSRITCFY